MKVFPIRVPRKSYKGSKDFLRCKRAEYNQCAARIERYLNDRIEAGPSPVQVYIYGFIAPDLELTTERVREVLSGVGGHNGLTVAKSPEALRDFLQRS